MAYGRMLAAIFLFSFASLAFEIALTRLFSISLWYHFAFMVISIAMLGIGASGTVLSLSVRSGPLTGNDLQARISIYGLLLGASITVSYVLANLLPFDPIRLSWDRTQLLYICLYYLLLSLPFFFFGLIVSTAFSSASERSGFVYGADLLGAGLGALSLLLLMAVTGPENAILSVSSVALSSSCLLGRRKTRATSLLLIACNALLFTAPELVSPRMSPYKGLPLALQYPGSRHVATYYSPFSRVDLFRSPAVRFAPGLSLKYLDPLPEQLGISIDGGELNAITRAERSTAPEFLKFLPSALPYEMGTRESVLVLDPRGGLQVLMARYYGARDIFVVESNPLLLRAIKNDFREFSGGIYDTNSWQGLGRSWLRTRQATFDLIDIPMAGAFPSGSFGISEDYRFTVEAFKVYLGHLSEQGVISIHLFVLPPPRVDLRIMSTLVTAMEEMGIRDIPAKIVSVRSWGSVVIVAKINSFTPEEIGAVRRFSLTRRFDLNVLPGIRDEETNVYVRSESAEYATSFRNILDPKTRNIFSQHYLFDIRPVRDDNPFFHYYLRLGNLREIYRIMGGKWQYFIEEGYLLPVVFVQVLVLSIVLISLPAITKIKRKVKVENEVKGTKNPGSTLTLLYFALLGLGFMFVEIPLIQKMILPLENPSYAVTAVLTSVLIGSGAGSLFSYRVRVLKGRFVLILIPVLVGVYSAMVPIFSDLIAPYSAVVKAPLVFAFLIPLGVPMGIPFPLGMRNLGRKAPDLIPWAWAVNGCTSVLAPIMTVMLAITVGFQAVMWTAAAAYLLAFFAFPAADYER